MLLNRKEMNMTTSVNELTEAIAEAIEALGYSEKDELSGYELAKLMTKLRGTEMKPQMTYNYMKKGMIKTTEVEGRRMVASEVAIEWIVKYITRNA